MTPYPDIWFVVMGIVFLVLVWAFIITGLYFLVRGIVRVVKRRRV